MKCANWHFSGDEEDREPILCSHLQGSNDGKKEQWGKFNKLEN